MGVVAEIPGPDAQPHQAKKSGDDERSAPGSEHNEPGDQRRSKRISAARKRVRDALGESAALLGKPHGHSAGSGGKRGAFAQAENESSGEERSETAHRTGDDGGHGNYRTAKREGKSRAETVAYPATDDLENRVENGEGRKNETNLRVAKMKIRFDEGRGGGDVDPIDVQDQVHGAQQTENNGGYA